MFKKIIRKILKIVLIYWVSMAILVLLLMLIFGLVGNFFLPKPMYVKAIDSYEPDLIKAACENNIPKMKKIIAKLGNGNRELRETCPYSALMKAVSCGSFEATLLLLIGGADPNLQTCGAQSCDQSVLKTAEENYNRRIIILLKIFGARKDLEPVCNPSPN